MQTDHISMHFVRAELRTIGDENTVAQLLQRADIARESFERHDARVTQQQFYAICHQVAQLLDDELAGRGLGKVPVGYFHTLCKYAIHGDTMLKCLARAAKFSNLFAPISGISLEWRVDGNTTYYTAMPSVERDENFFLIERHFINVYKYLTWVAGGHLQLRRAAFSISPPPYMDDYRRLFYCDLHFNEPRNELRFDTADLLRTPVHHEKDLAPMLEAAPLSFWQRPSIKHSYAAMVRRVLFDAAEGDAMDFETVSAKLEISTVTLRRRLKKEGISFQEIKDHIRRDKAIALMHDASKTISDIAFDLGYSDPSAFYRAFRQWVGATPNSYRAMVMR